MTGRNPMSGRSGHSPASSETLSTDGTQATPGAITKPDRTQHGSRITAQSDRTQGYEGLVNQTLPDVHPHSTLNSTAQYRTSTDNAERGLPETKNDEDYIVRFEGANDPDDPRNMRKGQKWAIVLIIAFCSLCVCVFQKCGTPMRSAKTKQNCKFNYLHIHIRSNRARIRCVQGSSHFRPIDFRGWAGSWSITARSAV